MEESLQGCSRYCKQLHEISTWQFFILDKLHAPGFPLEILGLSVMEEKMCLGGQICLGFSPLLSWMTELLHCNWEYNPGCWALILVVFSSYGTENEWDRSVGWLKTHQSFLLWTFCEAAALADPSTVSWSHRHCWWPWPLAGVLGAKRSLAPCENFRRSTSLCGFLLWSLTRQLSQQLLSEKGLNFWRLEEAAGSARSPLSALSCCLCPQVGMSLQGNAAWISLLASHWADLWHSFCSFLGWLCSSSPFKRVKAFSSVSTFLTKKA